MMNDVALKICRSYERKEVEFAVKSILDDLGGMDKFIKPGMKVAIKPNLVTKKKAETGATTHPEIVYAVSRLVKEAGAVPIIVESPGGLFNESILRNLYGFLEIDTAAKDAGAELNFDTSSKKVDIPEGKELKEVYILRQIAEADAVINLSKLKTHGMMVFSGAVKNMFGAIGGLEKAEYHLRMSDYDRFANAIIDIYLSAKVTLNIMDAITAMEGEGPTNGDARSLNTLIAAKNAFDLDLAASHIIGLEPTISPIMRNSIIRGLSKNSIDDIKVSEDINKFRVHDFNIPQADNVKTIRFFGGELGTRLMRSMKPKPKFEHDKCVGCGECAICCPAHIIKMVDRRPKVDLRGCISCFCCQEMCPAKAVTINRTIITKLIEGIRNGN